MKGYDHKRIEKKWQTEWQKKSLYKVKDAVKGKDNSYLLVEFPYPSGNLHVGHWYAFSVPDILARTLRMQGKNVLFPIGFDAFGLPAENAAIKNNINPKRWTEKNIAYMKNQIRSMGTMFDWSREVSTIDPAYYKWTQWQFLQFFKKGLAYRKETFVNWCPKDKTVLANEQVVDGKCERCKTEVVQRNMLQWNMKITDYADRLVDDLEPLNWPEQIKESQRNWIGRSEGALIRFKITKNGEVEVFTTRADTLFGVTYLVLAPEHKLVEELKSQIKNWDEVTAYVDKTKRKTELERQTEQKEKTGVELKGVKAINPATGKEIPVWVSDYVLAGYGTGGLMAVPAHDERDYEFAKKFNLPAVEVIEPFVTRMAGLDALRADQPLADRKAIIAVIQRVSDGKYLAQTYKPTNTQGLVSGGIEGNEKPEEAAVREIEEETGYTDVSFKRGLGSVIHSKYFSPLKGTNVYAHYLPLFFELKSDTHVPMSEEEKMMHDTAWMTKEELSMFINRADYRLAWDRAQEKSTYTGEGILTNSGEFSGMTSEEARVAIAKKFGKLKTTYKMRDWVVSRQRYWGVPIPIIHCSKCGEVAVPDKDLPVKLPEIKDYLPDGSGKSPLAKATKWAHVKCPNCKGKAERETDTLDTFVDSSWYFLRYTDPKNKKKFADPKRLADWMPVDLYSGGAEHTTMHVLYSRFWQKALYDLKLVKDKEPYARRMNRSLILGPDGQKMSKSRGNVIDPDEVVARLGADTVRMYLAFIGPYNEVSNYPWNPNGVVGVRRFLERVWRVGQGSRAKGKTPRPEALLHKTIKKVGEDIVALKFNTAISQLMIFLNDIEKEGTIGKEEWKIFLRLLAPFAPHIAEELWRQVGNKKSVHMENWPTYKESFLKEDTVMIGIQINGKTRGEVEIPSDADKEATEKAAREAVAARLEGKEIVRTIVVPGRLVNFVVKE